MCAHNRKGECMGNIAVKGDLLGYGAKMEPLRVGDRVDHTEKGFKGGVIVRGGEYYKGEVACIVDFPENSGWLARLSKLVVAKPTLADFGYKVGDRVEHLKYTHLNPLTITGKEVGEYKNEPCCFTGDGRPTRFSQIVPYVEKPVEPQPSEDLFGDDLFDGPDEEPNVMRITLPNGKQITIEIQ